MKPEQIAASMKGWLHDSRRIVINGSLDRDLLIGECAKAMLLLDFQSPEPITLLLSSKGGSYNATMQFCDFIAGLNSPVDVVAIGDCASMAVDLMQVCRRRILLPATRLLVHYIEHTRRWIGDDIELMEKDIEFFRKDMAFVRERRFLLYEKRTSLSRCRLLEIFRQGETHDHYFTAEQSIELGLADEIAAGFKFLPGRNYGK